MAIASPMLGLVAAIVAVVVCVAVRRWPVVGRWTLRAGVASVAVAVAGFDVRCDRPPRVAVMIDVSPSTRGAAFRDASAVALRLTPLLAGRPYTTHYFADGRQPTADEPACARTRLDVPPDAEAVVLLSDGRFDPPAAVPPTFVVVDPTLDRPDDARVLDLRDGGDRTFIAHVVGAAGRTLHLDHATPSTTQPPTGPSVVVAHADAAMPLRFPLPVLWGRVRERALPSGERQRPVAGLLPNPPPRVRGIGGQAAHATTADRRAARFTPGDRWPENDGLTLPPAVTPSRRWAFGIDAAGFERLAALPDDAAEYADTAAVLLATTAEVSPRQMTALAAFVRDFGGTVVLAGSPARTSPAVRALSPLSADPPVGPQTWTILLDASGSMAGPAPDGRSRQAVAVEAARSAVARLGASARVSVLTFARDVRTVVADATPADVLARLEALDVPPSGPTGLTAALRSLAPSPATPRAMPPAAQRRVLLLTDGDAEFGDAMAIGELLRQAGVTLDAVTPAAAGPLTAICRATGGQCAAGVDPADWAVAFGGLAAAGQERERPAGRAAGAGDLAGVAVDWSRRWAAHATADATVLVDASGEPVVAVRQDGLGHAAAVAAELPTDDWATIVGRLERPTADGRFVATWDEAGERVTLRVGDTEHDGSPSGGVDASDRVGSSAGVSESVSSAIGRPDVDGLHLVLRRDGRETPLRQTGPGTYAASLPRSAAGGVGVIELGGRVVSRHAMAGRYAGEFDAIGNDRAALTRLADASGGAFIEAGDTRPLALPTPVRWRTTRPAFTAGAAVLLLAAVWAVRRGV